MADTIKIVQSLAGAPFGGAENFYTRLVCALAENPRLEQTAFTRANPHRVPQLLAAGVPVQTFRFGNKLDPLDRAAYRHALRELAPEIVLTYMNRASEITPPGDYQLVCRLGHYYDLKYYRHANYWVGITQGICNHLIKGGMPADRVVQIPNFADESPVEAIPRDSFNTPTDRPLLLAAGRLHTNKAFDVLLQALPQIPDAILWLAGDGPEQKALEKLSNRLGLQERVRFLGWRDDVASLMKTADMFVCPSRHEGLGSIVVESWFHECPIVAANSQGPGELIEDGRTGLITPIDDAGALATAINSLLQDPQLASTLASNAKAHYDQHYSKATIARQYAELFERITG